MKWVQNTQAKVYRALDHPGFRFLLSSCAAAQATLKVGKRCRVSYHQGAWVQEFPNGVLVEPRLRVRVLPEIERTMKDLWMYEYVPRPGDTVVDVGAGTGLEVLCFSRLVGGSGRVIAMEAHPHTFDCLKEMCRRNKLQNVTTANSAATGKDCEVLISDTDNHTGNSIVSVGSGIAVRGVTLDTLLTSLQVPRVDLLKMNIEGAERAALDGMTQMIRQTAHVCISCHDFLADNGAPEETRTKAFVVAFLEQNGFDLTMRPSDPRPPWRYCVYGRNRDLSGKDSVAA